MKALILSVVLAASLPVATVAQNRTDSGMLFGFDVIYQDQTDLSFDGGSTVSLEDDWGLALTFGYVFNEHLDLGFALDWQEADYDATLQSGLLPGLTATVSGDLEAFTPRLWLNYNILKGPISPFLNGGIGWSFIDTNIPNSRVEVGCWWDPWWGYICTPYQSTKSIDEFVYQLGAGVRWNIADSYVLRLAYEKHWLDYGKASSTPDFDQWKLGFSYRY